MAMPSGAVWGSVSCPRIHLLTDCRGQGSNPPFLDSRIKWWPLYHLSHSRHIIWVAVYMDLNGNLTSAQKHCEAVIPNQIQRHYHHTTCVIAHIILGNKGKTWQKGGKDQSYLETKKKQHKKKTISILSNRNLIHFCLSSNAGDIELLQSGCKLKNNFPRVAFTKPICIKGIVWHFGKFAFLLCASFIIFL